jgi:hypothetical protein
MNKKELLELLNKMDDFEAVEIIKIGKDEYEISKFVHPITDKKVLSQYEIRTTSFVSIMTNKFQHYTEFGKKPVEENEIEREFILGLFETLVNAHPDSVENFTEKVNFLNYNVKKIDDFKGYYNLDGKLRFVISDGIDYWTSNKDK